MRRYGYGSPLLVLVLSLAVSCTNQSDDRPVERALVIDPTAFVEMPREQGRTPASILQVGPQIELRSPEDDTVFQADEPVAIHLEFLPADDGTEPDMATLEVEVRQKRAFGLWFGKDMTDEVSPYIEGSAIRIPEVDLKGYTGDFRFFVRIQDQQDRENEARFSLTLEASLTASCLAEVSLSLSCSPALACPTTPA